MSEKRELPPELKAIEAELAALIPRTDELDRERLIFLAGQASAEKATVSPGSHASGMIWPIATAVTTAIAISLAVVLVTRSQPEAVTRVVYRYIPRPEAIEDGSTEQFEADDLSPDALPVNRPDDDDSKLSMALAWIDFPDRQRVRFEADNFRRLDRMLDQRAGLGADEFSESPIRRSPRTNRRAAAPVTYQGLLDSVLETTGPNSRQPDSSATGAANSSGVNS
jgi:hypothetical protein